MFTIKKFAGILGAVLALGISNSAWSDIALENPLGDNYYSEPQAPRIDMTKINLTYTGWRPGKSTLLIGSSSASTALSLIGPNFSSAAPFDGTFNMRAYISPKGVLTGGRFSFTSSDSMFGFGSTCVSSVCTANTGTVFSGKLDSVGWSESKGFLEFGTSNFSGWACAQGWCTPAERLYFTTNKGTLGITPGMNNFSRWYYRANGTAVIPVPAAAWLFGSGLIGLVGVAKRKRKI